MKQFVRREVAPSWWANALDNFLAPFADNFLLRRASATSVEVPAGPGEQRVSVAIDTLWRYIDATVNRSHPGGPAGEYVVWAVTGPNVIDNDPEPYSDHTNYSFQLRITPVGQEPAAEAGPPAVAFWREVGRLEWDGAAITALEQTIDVVPGARLADDVITTAGGLTAQRQAGGGFLISLPDGSVGASKIADALKPSQGAATGTEALRALGLAAGMAMPGTHKPAAIYVISPSDNWGKDSVRNFNATGGRCYALFAVTGYAVAAQNNYVMRANLWRGVPGNAASVGVAEHWSYADKEYRWMMGFFDMGVLNGAQSMFWNSVVGGHFDYDANGRTVLAVFEVK